MNHPLEDHRAYFLQCFREGIGKARDSLDQFATELLLELSSLKYPDYCYRLYRADIVGKRDGKNVIREITLGGRDVLAPPGVFPASVSFDAPVVWYGIEFVVAGSTIDEARLIEWTTRWLDVTDSRYVESAEFQEVIHNVRPPKKTDAGFEISVDFGTAPVAAFDELVQILSTTGKVSVGSFMTEDEKTEAQPGATDNPDDAQRLREDH